MIGESRRPPGDGVGALGIGVVLFAVYALGACRTIYVGDSGELVAAVYVLGVPHPTGYPLYVMLGKLWTLLVPFGSVAFRMSLFSAACAAASCSILYLVARRLDCGRVAALCGALVLAFSPSFWGEANVQRVYALNALFVSAATYGALEWYLARSVRWMLGTVFLCGLGAANHTFMAVYGVAFGVFALAVDAAVVLRPRTLAAVIAAGAIGLLPYAYLPIASSFDPPLDWGNPQTWDAFLAVVERRDFWQRAWIESPMDLLPIGWDYVRGMGGELAWVGVPIALVGFAAPARRGFNGLLLLVMFFNVLVMALHGSRSDLFIWHRYYIPSYAMASLLLARGVDVAAARLRRSARRVRRVQRVQRVQRVAWAALLLPLVLFTTGWSRFDRSRYRIAEDYSRILLSTIPPGSSLAATDDNILFVLIYLTMVEGVRPDVNLILQGVGGNALPALRFDPEKEPLYFTHHPNWNHPILDVVPVGQAFRVWRRGVPLPPVKMPPDELPGANDADVPKDYLTQNLVGHYYFMLGFTAERSDWPRARRFFERAMHAAPSNDVLFYNVGLIFERNGLLEEALAAFRRSHEINPRHIANSDRVRAWDKVVQMEKEIGARHP